MAWYIPWCLLTILCLSGGLQKCTSVIQMSLLLRRGSNSGNSGSGETVLPKAWQRAQATPGNARGFQIKRWPVSKTGKPEGINSCLKNPWSWYLDYTILYSMICLLTCYDLKIWNLSSKMQITSITQLFPFQLRNKTLRIKPWCFKYDTNWKYFEYSSHQIMKKHKNIPEEY